MEPDVWALNAQLIHTVSTFMQGQRERDEREDARRQAERDERERRVDTDPVTCPFRI